MFVAIAGTLFLILASLSPIMVVYDGCTCGRARKWYEFPHSPFPNRAFHVRIIKSGDPSHKHVYWDAQWDVYFQYPWQN